MASISSADLEEHGEVDALAGRHLDPAHVEVAEDRGGAAHGVVVRAHYQARERLQRRLLILEQRLLAKSYQAIELSECT